jgi:hypothetical protein
VYAYWGWYWRDVYAQIPLIVAQLVFLYASTRWLDLVRAGGPGGWASGPLPVILSSNSLHLVQGRLVRLPVPARGDGRAGQGVHQVEARRADDHVFNPSAFTLGLFSLRAHPDRHERPDLGRQHRGHDQRHPPHIYVVIFLLG